MGVQVDMRVTELLCSRLCHDLVGPVGAINHGVELIGEENSPVLAEATKMLGQSAQQAANRLEFFRVAFGLSGGGSGTTSLAQGRRLALGFLDRQAQLHWPFISDLPWSDHENVVPKDVIKVILNMLMLALDCLPRGGELSLSLAVLPEGLGIALDAQGAKAEIREEIKAALEPGANCDSLNARTVQAYFLAKLIEDLGIDFEAYCPEVDSLQFAAIVPLDL